VIPAIPFLVAFTNRCRA